MKTLNAIQELTTGQATERKAALRRYRELIADDDASPAELKDVLRVLGKTPANAATEQQAFNLAASLRQRIRAADGIGRKVEASAAALREHQEETNAISHDRKLGYQSLMRQQAELVNVHRTAQQAREELARLEWIHPDVLAEQP